MKKTLNIRPIEASGQPGLPSFNAEVDGLPEGHVIANPELSGSEPELESIQIGEEKYKTPTVGLIIQAEEDVTLQSPNPSWVVPSLTPEQVTQAYNALVAGKHVTVENADGDVQYTVILGDGLTEDPAIVLVHYWLGFVDYQITNDTVEITAHEISGGGGKKLYKHDITVTVVDDENYADFNFSVITDREDSYVDDFRTDVEGTIGKLIYEYGFNIFAFNKGIGYFEGFDIKPVIGCVNTATTPQPRHSVILNFIDVSQQEFTTGTIYEIITEI